MVNSQAEILDRMIRPEEGTMSQDAAREMLKLGFQEPDHARMAELSAKAQENQLTDAERNELNDYINISHLLALMQSKARRSINNGRGGPSAA